MASRGVARVLQRRTKLALKWVQISEIDWEDPSGRKRVWEAADRTTKREGCSADAVAVIPLIKRGGGAPLSTVVVAQFRPPVGKICLEFPAGLIDTGESPEEAAVRELREETGLRGTARKASPLLGCDPGLSGATMYNVFVDIDGTAEANRTPVAEPDEGEFIEVMEFEVAKLRENLVRLQQEKGYLVDARLFSTADGLEMLMGTP